MVVAGAVDLPCGAWAAVATVVLAAVWAGTARWASFTGSSMTPEGEGNPFLGQRCLRLSLAAPELFTVQLLALARAAAEGPVTVIVPMVTVPAELAEGRRLPGPVTAALPASSASADLVFVFEKHSQ